MQGSADLDADDPSVIHVAGDLDMHSAARLTDAIDLALGAGAGPVIYLDLSEVTFVDSSGLAALIHGEVAVSAAERSLVLRSVPESVMRPLRMTQLDGSLHIEP